MNGIQDWTLVSTCACICTHTHMPTKNDRCLRRQICVPHLDCYVVYLCIKICKLVQFTSFLFLKSACFNGKCRKIRSHLFITGKWLRGFHFRSRECLFMKWRNIPEASWSLTPLQHFLISSKSLFLPPSSNHKKSLKHFSIKISAHTVSEIPCEPLNNFLSLGKLTTMHSVAITQTILNYICPRLMKGIYSREWIFFNKQLAYFH